MGLQTGQFWRSRSGREEVQVVYVDRFRARVSFSVVPPRGRSVICEWLTLADFARFYPHRMEQPTDDTRRSTSG